MEMADRRWCFHCLQQRISADFSDELVFSRGISDSAFPFGTSAVVQLPTTSAEIPAEFTLVYLSRHEQDCLTKYVDAYFTGKPEANGTNHVKNNESSSNINEEQGVVRTEVISEGTQSGSPVRECHQFSDISKKACLDGSEYEVSNCGCNYCGWFSCSKTITALAPLAHVGTCSYSTIELVASNYLSAYMEDHILSSINLLIEGKASGKDGRNFLSLIGIPSFNEDNLPGCLRHPNIVPVLGILKSPSHVSLVLPKTPYTLENVLMYSPDALKSDWHIEFLMYQLLSALSYSHSQGIAHGNVCPSSVLLSNSCWLWLQPFDKQLVTEHSGVSPLSIGCCTEGCPCQGMYADLKITSSLDWNSAFNQWWRGELSNFEYLLILNKLAGRRWGDHTFHTVMPWVIDFSTKPDEQSEAGWRDLSKSKWRLAKGDEQLDFTYSTSEIPHHISDECLSELAVCSYKARRLPLSVLRMAVRSVYEPNEYPLTIQRLYQWTPDECIPEFYCDSQIFCSIHSGMTDLAIPTWVGTPEEFIKLHRDALESDRVSRQIHHWIDITFGYKMSGEAALSAKNVMLSSSDPTMPRSVGRRQLFAQPHPIRLSATRRACDSIKNLSLHQRPVSEENMCLPETAYMQELEKVSAFCQQSLYLCPHYYDLLKNVGREKSSFAKPACKCYSRSISRTSNCYSGHMAPSCTESKDFLDNIEMDDEAPRGYQGLLLWNQKVSYLRPAFSKDLAGDIFSVGCILAELYLRRPLFDLTSLALYLECGVLPGLMQELPFQIKMVVEACIRRDWRRRPSATSLLTSPYFLPSVRSAYFYLAPLHLLAKEETRLSYAANFAKQGGLKAMGSFAAEMCASYCLPLLAPHLKNTDAELACILLKEFLQCLKQKAIKALIIPAIQKILQATGYSHLKVSLLQDSFVRDLLNRIGKQAYLEYIHPLVLSNLYTAPHKSSASAASVLLIGSSEELGIPVTVHQTILPLLQCFGRGLCADGIDVLVRIGGLLGETFVVRHMLPLLKNVVHSCIDVSCTNKREAMQNWSALACIDCLMVLDGLVSVLPTEVVMKELIQDRNCLYITILMQTNLDLSVLEVAATTLVAICQRVGPEMTAVHVLPRLKELFDEIAFSQESARESNSIGRSLVPSTTKSDEGFPIENRMDLVLLLYPSFASILGIEKLRHCCATWLLLEQFLLRYHKWKWEYSGESSKSGAEGIIAKMPILSKVSTSDYSPAKLLLNGVGWSIPQSQGARGAKNLMPHKQVDNFQNPVDMNLPTPHPDDLEPWFWFPSPAPSWEGLDFLGRSGSLKDELPWKIRASVVYSVRAHHGGLRSLAVCQDECTVLTTGVGPGFKGTVQNWDLMRMKRVSGYYGHEEVVNDLCFLSSHGRAASCDGTVHVWNSQNGKLISVFSESSSDSANLASSFSSASKTNTDQSNMLNSNSLSSGILTGAFDGASYTCMHLVQHDDKLVVGTGNGSLRFIDIAQGRKLHLWKTESLAISFPSLISSICSCGSDKILRHGGAAFPSWIAAGLSSGHCRLLDARSGNVISSWRAHDGYLTKLAAPEDHLLVSSSLDRSIRIWDLRRSWPSQPIVVRGHRDGVSGFSVWGKDVISISRNMIGLSSLSGSTDGDGHQEITPQKLYTADRGTRNLSVLSSISIMPFSRLFLVGTEDGHLKICC